MIGKALLRLSTYLYGSLDALHKASALIGKAKTLIATDSRLREAAGMMGLNVLP